MAVEFLTSFGATLVGLAFVASGIGKLVDQSRFVEVVREYRLLPESAAAVVGWTLPGAELVLGIGLLMGLFWPWFPAAAAVLLLVFTGAVAANLARGRSALGCGCFGGTGGARLGWTIVTRNVALAIVVAPWWTGVDPGGPGAPASSGGLAAQGVAVLGVLGCLLSARLATLWRLGEVQRS